MIHPQKVPFHSFCYSYIKSTVLICPTVQLSFSMEFDYLSEIPILTLDVNEDFKGDKEKYTNLIEKV